MLCYVESPPGFILDKIIRNGESHRMKGFLLGVSYIIALVLFMK